jgi:hypothetical protein
MSNNMPGGWSNFNFSLTPEALNVFGAAMEGFVGVSYKPLAFATQIVAGTNYCYLCQGKAVYPDAPDIAAKVYVFQPLQGKAHITQIIQITP